MLDLEELQQLAAFAELGTLSHVAARMHISTPSVTRSMQHLEEVFGVPLFIRGKNKIELNSTGKIAAAAASRVLQEAEAAIRQVRDFDARQRTLVIKACAPAPLWELQRELNTARPGMMLASAICQNDEVLTAWQEGACDLAILPFAIAGAKPYMQEDLYVCVPLAHELAKRSELTFNDINGFNFLLRTELGFWDTLCREKMPASKFLVQPEAAVFEELVRASSLPCFTTNYGPLQAFPGRVNIPLTNAEAHVTFYVLSRERCTTVAVKAN